MENQVQGTKLQFFPIPIFATVMGLAGLSIVLLKTAHLFNFPMEVGRYFLFGVTAWFALLLFAYCLKWIRYPQEVKEELHHPVRMNFFPAISICFLLLAIAYMSVSKQLAWYFWIIGTPLHLFFLLRSLSVWFHKEFQIHSFNPSWFIPVVGPLLIPVAGIQLVHPEISWFFFSTGLIYWLVLLSVFMNRVLFHNPIPAKLVPTLFILIAPPAVGFIAYTKLTGQVDSFGRILFYFGVFTALMLLTMLNRFRKVPFFISWWAYTFPLDALTLSTVLMYEKTHLVFFKWLALFFLSITLLVIALVFVKTVRAASKGEICVPD